MNLCQRKRKQMKLKAYNQYLLVKLLDVKQKTYGESELDYGADDDSGGMYMDAGEIMNVGPLAFGQYAYLHGLDKPTEKDLIGKKIYFKPKMWETALFDQYNQWLDNDDKDKRFRLIEDRDVMAFIED